HTHTHTHTLSLTHTRTHTPPHTHTHTHTHTHCLVSPGSGEVLQHMELKSATLVTLRTRSPLIPPPPLRSSSLTHTQSSFIPLFSLSLSLSHTHAHTHTHTLTHTHTPTHQDHFFLI